MKIKVFSCSGKRTDIMEDEVNEWLVANKDIHIINITSTSNATVEGADSFCSDKLYLVIVYDI